MSNEPHPDRPCEDHNVNWCQVYKSNCRDNLYIQKQCPVTCRLCPGHPRHPPGPTSPPCPRHAHTTKTPTPRHCPTDPAWCTAHPDVCDRSRIRHACPRTCEMCSSRAAGQHTHPPSSVQKQVGLTTTGTPQPATEQFECVNHRHWCHDRRHECGSDFEVWSMCPKACELCRDWNHHDHTHKSTPSTVTTAPNTDKSTPIIITTTPTESKTTPIIITTTPTESKTTPIIITTTPTESKTTSTVAVLSISDKTTSEPVLTTLESSKATPKISLTTPTSSNITPKTDVATPTMNETKPTAQDVSDSGDITTPLPGLSTRASSPEPPITSTRRCYQCGSPGSPCSLLALLTGQPSLCPPGLDFCLSHVTQVNGNRQVIKSCVDRQTCHKKWYEESSDLTECVTFDSRDTILDLECSFCCRGDNCNKGVIPDIQSLYDPSVY